MKKVIGFFLVILLSFAIWATIGSVEEHIKIELTLQDFISKATLIESESTSQIKYYEVKSDIELDAPSYHYYNNRMVAGAPGDIILTRTSDIEIPFIQQGISFYVGGHAALLGYDYYSTEVSFNESNTFEITGVGSDITSTKRSSYSYFTTHYPEFFVYRVKTSAENRFKAFINAMSYYGQSYNYTFIFNQKNTRYCSDLIKVAYEYVGVNLNYDGVATTVLDIMASPDVYLVFYSRIDENGVRYNYALV